MNRVILSVFKKKDLMKYLKCGISAVSGSLDSSPGAETYNQ